MTRPRRAASRHVLGLLALVQAGLATPAWATSTRFCVRYDIDFVDIDGSATDDMFNDDSTPVPAWGVYLTVSSNTPGGGTPWDGYTYATSGSPGCTDYMTLDPYGTYTVKVTSKAQVDGNFFEVHDNATHDSTYAYTIASFHPLNSPFPVTANITTSQQDWWNIAAATGWVAQRDFGAFIGETIVVYSDACGGGGNCESSSGVFIQDSGYGFGAENKYVIAHELGHRAARLADGGLSPNKDYTCPVTTCEGGVNHALRSKEYQSAAAVEGFAHFLAAYAFNDDKESDCFFYNWGGGADWDRDGDHAASAWFSCEGSPAPDETTGSYDYLGETCDPLLYRRGNEYDWLRFWWDMATDEGLPLYTIYDIWDDGDPNDWNATTSGPAADNPPARLESAASALGYGAEYNAQDNLNGVDR